MRTCHWEFICLAGLTVLVAASAAEAQSKDYVYRREGPLISGKIEAVTPDSIRIQDKSDSQTISVDQISKLRFSDEPSGFDKVRTAFEAGQLEQAGTDIASLEPAGRDFVRQEIEYYKAAIAARLALQGRGSVNPAVRQLVAFVKDNANHFRYYDACEILGDLAMSLGKFETAAKSYARLGNSKSANIMARGNLLQGDALLRQGDVKKALAMYRKSAAAEDFRLRSLGHVGVATCLAQMGQAGKAIEQIEKVIAESDAQDKELFARAYNGLGRAFAVAGNEDAALESFLHTDLLFYQDADLHAEALFHLAKLWTEKNKPAEATRARNTLKQKYSTSLWAKM